MGEMERRWGDHMGEMEMRWGDHMGGIERPYGLRDKGVVDDSVHVPEICMYSITPCSK